MAWIVTNRKNAELAGADSEYDRVLLAVTPNYVAERYQDHRTAETGDEEDDHWGRLTEQEQTQIVQLVDAYCDKALSTIDNDISDIFTKFQAPPNGS